MRIARPSDSLSAVARARTLTVLTRLDGNRKKHAIQFLYESDLITKEQTFVRKSGLIESQQPAVRLAGANLSGADLSSADLSGADLSGADLGSTQLGGLFPFEVGGVYLGGADLAGAELHEADLRRATLNEANLAGANLAGANLREADVTEEQLAKCKSLRGVTMPNGQKYEDWLKYKEGRGEDGENSSPS